MIAQSIEGEPIMEIGNIPGYTIKRKLGAGGMAEVYLATQESFGRDVAVKVLLPSSADNQDFAARFLREAKIVAGLSHPHIISVYDVGQSGGCYYMSMDYLPGGDLTQWIKTNIAENEILKIIEQIADALQYAHQKGYMHRDIKPANIMFREDNSAVLTDFGIARMQNADDQLTQAGLLVGTPTYMSPEVLKGHAPDGRADIYALGIVFYEMLMKTVPYKATEFTALAFKHLQEPIPQLPKAYGQYQDFLKKILAKKPEDRFQSGREITKAIQQLRSPATESVAVNTTVQRVAVAEPSVPHNPTLSLEKTMLLQRFNEGQQGISFEEKSERHGLFKKMVLVSNLNVNDPHTLSMYFSNALDKLTEWRKQYGDKIETIEFNFVTKAWCFDHADKAVIKLHKSGGVFEFLKKVTVKVTMVSYDGLEHMSYELNKKGEKILLE